MSASSEKMLYPAVMDHKLRRIRRRQCALVALRAVLLAAAALVAAMLTAMVLDWQLTFFETSARVSLTIASLAFALATLALVAFRPLIAAVRLPRGAECADREVPQLEERWTTVAGLADRGQSTQTSLERAMLKQVTREAVALGRLVEPARVAKTAQLRRPLWLAVGYAAALAGFLAVDWRQTIVLLQRFWAPFADISATRLESVTGDALVPRGEALEIGVNMSGLPRSSAILFLDSGGASEAIELQPNAEGAEQFVYRTAVVEESFRYRLQAGDGRTPWHTVTVIDRPSLAEVRFSLAAPDYVDRPKYEKPYLPDRVRALEGSRLSLELRPASPLARLELLLSRESTNRESDKPGEAELPEHLPLRPDADGWYRFQTTLSEDLTLSPLLVSPEGLAMIDRPQCHLHVIADQSPVARVIRPNEEQLVAADAVVDVQFEAHDDLGVARAELIVYGEPDAEGEQPPVLSVQRIPLDEQNLQQHVTAAAKLDLAKLNLSEGETISFAVRVADNRDAQIRNTAMGVATEGDTEPVDEKKLERREQLPGAHTPVAGAELAESGSPLNYALPADDAPAVAIPGHRRDDPVRLNEPRVAVLPQPPNHNDAGQSVESNRLRLKIAASLASTDDAGEEGEASPIDLRKQMVHIEKMLRESETVLNQLVEESAPTAIDDPQLQQLKGTDERLANVEQRVGELRKQSKDTPYAFAGLQMVEIAGSHVSPARDRLFAIVRQPESDPDANLLEALHRVGRARELLAELLVRFDQAVRELQLADSLEEVAKMYEVYVAGAQRLLRAQSTPAANPLERKMAILELDQEYLNRLREVLEMRRDLMSELGRMLGDDPRLRGKYLDLVKRRQDSLRDAFHSLYQRQTALAAELAAWRQLDETQREDIWAVAAELRLQDLALLAKDAAQLEEQVTSQLPLGLDATGGAAAVVLDDARQLAVAGRAAAIKARRLIRDSLNEDVDLKVDLDAVEFRVGELDAALERLAAEGNDDETAAFVAKRLADSRALAEKLACRSETASHLRHRQYAGLAQVDQRLLAMQTQQLRTALQNAGDELNGQFDGKVPPDILGIARQLDVEIEAITFNQTAAAFSLSGELADAETQQLLALAAFQRAEELFDRMRRMVIEVLDQNDPDNPTAADLEDPTLDEILERLEREPDLSALLGIPDRPRNLRVLSDWMLWNQQSNGLLGTMEELARRTKQQAEELVRPVRRPGPGDEEKKDEEEPVEYLLARQIEELRRQAADPKIEPEQADKLRRALERLEALREKMAARQRDDDLTEQEWQQVAEAEMAEEMLEEKIDELRRQAALPETDSEEAEKLRQAAERLEALRRRLADQNRGGDGEQKQPPERLRPGALRSMIEALLAAETLNVEQWNRVLSSLDDGLWQVRRRVPPDQYRRAIEQYQEQIRRLRSWEASDATSP